MTTHVPHSIGQQFIIGLSGQSLTDDERRFIVEEEIGGVILMRRNVAGPEQVRALCLEIQSLRHQMKAVRDPLFISIDMEGGRVQRLCEPFTIWPALSKVGALDSETMAYQFALAMGHEMRAVGINLDFAPCIDIFTNPANTVIGDRALGTQAEPVARLGSALIRGYMKAGVIACAKHFPGHGNTFVDSHLGLPVEDKSLGDLEKLELEPYRKVFRGKLDLVMAAHILLPKIDATWPASLSSTILQNVLRSQLGYQELIVTDDLDMKALTLHHSKGDIAVRALQAGCNILLYCNEPDSPPTAIEAIRKAIAEQRIRPDVIADNVSRIRALKRSRLQSCDPLSLEQVRAIVGCDLHRSLATAIGTGLVSDDLKSQLKDERE